MRSACCGSFVKLLFATSVLLFFFVPVPAGEDEGEHVRYVTTPFLEPDRCATAWVISRYVDPSAVFEFHNRGEIPEDVVLYDLPEAELKRDARRATVEVLVQDEGIQDPFVLRLARLVHDVEIVAWATRREPGSLDFEGILTSAMKEAASAEDALNTCFELLDGLRDSEGEVDAWWATLSDDL